MQNSQQSISDAYVMALNLHHSLVLNYRNSQSYCITSESDRQFRSLRYLFSILLDIVLECNPEDTDHLGPTTMNVQIFSPERKTGEALILNKISRLVWKHHGNVKPQVSAKPRFLNPTKLLSGWTTPRFLLHRMILATSV